MEWRREFDSNKRWDFSTGLTDQSLRPLGPSRHLFFIRLSGLPRHYAGVALITSQSKLVADLGNDPSFPLYQNGIFPLN